MDPERILTFWFGENLENAELAARRCSLWFGRFPDFDEGVRQNFGHLPELAAGGHLASWLSAPRSCLALALILDQFPRNLFRNQPEAFAFDRIAVHTVKTALGFRFERQVHPLEAAFFYMPLEHAENRDLQRLAVERFRDLVKRAPPNLRALFRGFFVYALAHNAVIRRFGRFPHRNQVLGRISTEEETAFLAGGGATFGGMGPGRGRRSSAPGF